MFLACCYDIRGLLVGLLLQCFVVGDYSPALLALFWEACSLLGALIGSVAVIALCSILFLHEGCFGLLFADPAALVAAGSLV